MTPAEALAAALDTLKLAVEAQKGDKYFFAEGMAAYRTVRDALDLAVRMAVEARGHAVNCKCHEFIPGLEAYGNPLCCFPGGCFKLKFVHPLTDPRCAPASMPSEEELARKLKDISNEVIAAAERGQGIEPILENEIALFQARFVLAQPWVKGTAILPERSPFDLLEDLAGALSHAQDCDCYTCECLQQVRRELEERRREGRPPFHKKTTS